MKIRYRYLATRGGYLATVKSTKISLQTEIRQELHEGEVSDPVQAIPKPNTVFIGWSDGVKSNPRTDTGAIPENDTCCVGVIAHFKMRPWWIRLVAKIRR